MRYAYYLTCQRAIKDEEGNVIELRCTYDPETKGGSSPDGRKVKGTIHWVSAQHADDVELRLYRYAQEGYKGKDHVKRARIMAQEIIDLVRSEESPGGSDEG